MANKPKLDDLKKDIIPSKAPAKTNIFGEKSGVNLIESVKLNINPLQIPGLFVGEKYTPAPSNSPLYANSGGWNAFQSFLVAKGIVKNPTNNSDENKKLIDELIAEFNSGEATVNGKVFDHIKKFPQNKITTQQIILAQTYHKITDAKVQIDGWVGSQTSQLRYPVAQGFYIWDGNEEKKTGNKTLPLIKKDVYIPIVWGNKRFILKVENQVENYYKTDGSFSLPQDRNNWILYTPDKFPDIKFAIDPLPKEWYIIDQSTEPNKSASAVNVITAQTNKVKENLKSQTNVVSNILNKK